MNKDETYMNLALELARKASGRTSPNPLVGAVLVRQGRVLAEGFHRKAGTAHAEAVALRRAGPQARGATLYVTLEPCCHTEKRTPPCAQAVIRAGVKRVVVAMKDPNPKVSGRGLRMLKEAGVEVRSGVLAEEARLMNRWFIHYMKTGRPYVTLKVAQTVDGRIATASGESKWITGPSARRAGHRLRAESDAIMVGIGTVRADDPSLTCRISGGRNPVRIIVDGRLEIRPEARVLDTREAATWIATCVPEDHPARAALEARGAEVIHVPGRNGKLDLQSLMNTLGQRQITSLLLEGGSSLNAACLAAGVVQRAVFFIAPKILGGRNGLPSVGGPDPLKLEEAIPLKSTRLSRVGRDLVIEADLDP